jgi:hypothetical protein
MDNKAIPVTREPTPPPEPIEVCATCGGPTTRKMFRTGSVDHPGKDVQVCPGCGTRR